MLTTEAIAELRALEDAVCEGCGGTRRAECGHCRGGGCIHCGHAGDFDCSRCYVLEEEAEEARRVAMPDLLDTAEAHARLTYGCEERPWCKHCKDTPEEGDDGDRCLKCGRLDALRIVVLLSRKRRACQHEKRADAAEAVLADLAEDGGDRDVAGELLRLRCGIDQLMLAAQEHQWGSAARASSDQFDERARATCEGAAGAWQQIGLQLTALLLSRIYEDPGAEAETSAYCVGSWKGKYFLVDKVYARERDAIAYSDSRACRKYAWSVMKAPLGGDWIDWEHVHTTPKQPKEKR